MGTLIRSQLCNLAHKFEDVVPPDLTLAVILEESGGQVAVASGAGAVGLMQIMQRFHPNIDLANPETNVRLGTHLLASYMSYVNDWQNTPPSFDEIWSNRQWVRRALAAYVMGPGNVRPYPDEERWGETVVQYVTNVEALYGRKSCSKVAD